LFINDKSSLVSTGVKPISKHGLNTSNQVLQNTNPISLSPSFKLTSLLKYSFLSQDLGISTELFDLAVDRFRDQLKLKVENKASEIFQNLVSDNAFKSLRINDNYGLKIMNNFGSIIDHRGAGVEQIVALSLILALGKSAVRSGTLVLDTPFGRLDETHRKNILRKIEGKNPIDLMNHLKSIGVKLD
jgi:hypothetical protein